MSRALNIDVSEADILGTCAKHNIPISTMEALASGGTRVVFNNADDTAAMAKRYRAKVIKGPVIRVATRPSRSY